MDIYFRYSDNLMIYSYGYFFPARVILKECYERTYSHVSPYFFYTYVSIVHVHRIRK